MNYDLIITKIDKPASRNIIARLMAGDLSTSIQKAISELENLPTVYKRDLSEKEVRELALKLNKLGATCRLIESVGSAETTRQKQESVDDYVNTELKQGVSRKPVMTTNREIKHTPQEKVTFSKNIPDNKPSGGKKTGSLIIILVIVFSALVIALFSIGKKREIKIKRTDALVKKKGKEATRQKASKRIKGTKKNTQKSSANKRTLVNPVQKKSSKAFTDSAVHYSDNTEMAIKFYKIALSFNQYNLKAWQGLIVAYRNAGKIKEAAEAKKQMEELFGKEIFSIKEIVAPYGELSDYSLDINGVCRIEYKSGLTSQPDLERETYLLIRAVLSHKKCSSVSLYASTGKGSGMLVRIDTRAYPSSVTEYKKRAVITFIE